ncbi:hypothetical protein P3342_012662 [Pyrenophora teres f. teres]|nr:hypothetical protein P3342_012662 [Pyrenophora teres f. teres]
MSRTESPFVRQTEDESYTWIHRAFLQAFQTHGILTLDEIKPILAHIVTASNPNRPWTAADITQPFLTSTLQTINAKLIPLDYEIRWAKDQTPKPTLHYALVNNASDPLTQQATRFSPTEIAYIRRLLDFMFDTNNTSIREVMAVSELQASNLARPSRRPRQSTAVAAEEEGGEDQTAPDAGLSLQDAEDVLYRLVTTSFFSKSSKGYYTLAPRSLIELRSYLKETYNDDDIQRIRDCHGCKEIVTVGIRCNNRECGVRWHDGCANAFYRGRGGRDRLCPKCKTECGGNVFVGERADTVRGGGRGRGSLMTQEEDDEEEDDEEEE